MRDVEPVAHPPPIPNHRKAVYEFYQLTFDEAGCAMKRTPSGMVFHPILPPYLICDLVAEFEKSRDPSLLHHAENILQRAMPHAERRHDALLFIYRPESELSKHPHAFYSALTQAWYIKAICDLSRHVGDAYKSELHQVFRSLEIPYEQGGVLVRKDFGWTLEEYPSSPHLYTLNGWLTVLRMIIAHRKTLAGLGVDYHEMLDRNLDAVEHLLPLYDAGFCLNSRYQLAGFTRMRFVFDRSVSHTLQDFRIEIPGDATVEGHLTKQTGYRWENYIERHEEKLLQLNVVLSLASHPQPNAFHGNLKVSRDCKAKIFVAEGDYRPDLTSIPTDRWRQIASISLSAAATNPLKIEILFDKQNLFSYPTNFNKNIGGVFYNVYHFVHIIDLAEMYAFSGRETFREYATKWLEYYEQWPRTYKSSNRNYSLLPYKYGKEFRSVVIGKMERSNS